MSWNICLLLLVGIPSADQSADYGDHFTNYYRASEAARTRNKPLLVVLNRGPQWEGDALSLADVRKTRERRDLLKNYVVVVVDATTPHGEVVHRAYRKPELPHVAIVGKYQRYLLFETGKPLYGQRWTEILTTHRTGVRAVKPRIAAYCPT